MNATIASLTVRGMLGRRRVLFLFLLPALVLVLAVGIRVAVGEDTATAAGLLSGLVLGTTIPLLGVIVGTGAIGPEIDDGSIIYVLAKPVPRPTVVLTKLAVAVGCMAAFGAVPTLLAGLILVGFTDGIAVGFGVGTLVAGVAYSALFLLLAIITRHAVVVGLMYALLWESLIGGLVPGAQTLSIQQWGLAVTETVVQGPAVISSIGLPTAVILLLVVTVASTVLAGQRLRSLTLTDAE